MTARIAILASAVVVAAALAGALLALAGGSDGDADVDAAAKLDRRVSRTATLERGDFGEFSQSEATRGSLTVSREQAFDGTHAALARYAGGPGNGFARATQNVRLRDGEDVWYGAAFFLPAGFKRAMQGEVALMRWDNYAARGGAGDVGGVVVWGSDPRARLILAGYRRRERILAGPIELPEGRWFSLLVHQRLGGRRRARNEVYVDGLIADSSAAANTASRPILRIRFGLVALDGGAQLSPLDLWFDRCLVTARRRPAADRGAAERAWAIAPAID